jgi:hypothetical protein
VRRFPRRSPDPWLRSIDESLPRDRNDGQRSTLTEIFIAATVIAAIIVMAIWFVFFSHGGIGPGSV